jgi:Fe-S cluster assembly iron-binding protein IscA
MQRKIYRYFVGKEMIDITEHAKEELNRLLIAKVDWPGALLRLLDRGKGKLGLGIDIQKPGDEVIEYEGKRLLLVEATLAANLEDITLDVDNTPDGTELVIIEKSQKQSKVTEIVKWKPLTKVTYSLN